VDRVVPPGAIVDIGGQARERRAAVPKRQYSLEYKLQVVKEIREPGASVSIVAWRHDINTTIVFRWRKLFQEGRLGGRTPGLIEVVLRNGVRVRVDAQVDDKALRRVVAAVRDLP
jgi:transposase-like protein